MRSQTDLSALQLQIVMHVANGMTFDEIANTLILSKSYVQHSADRARRKMKVRTLPQLVSVVIAEGLLEWEADRRVLNGQADPDQAV